MGDMADAALDDVMDMEDARLDFHMGDLSASEAYDRGLIDELGFEVGGQRLKLKRCRFCNQRGLFWAFIAGHGWRLHEHLALEKGMTAHVCTAYQGQNTTG